MIYNTHIEKLHDVYDASTDLETEMAISLQGSILVESRTEIDSRIIDANTISKSELLSY